MSFLSPLKSCTGYKSCGPHFDKSQQRGHGTATDLPFSESDPLISKVMGEGPLHFVVIVSNAVLPVALAFVTEVHSLSTLLNEHFKSVVG